MTETVTPPLRTQPKAPEPPAPTWPDSAALSRLSLVALILANLFVVAQTLRHEWGYYQTLLVYWLEVVIIGCFNVLRMAVVGVFGAAPLGTWAAGWLDLGSRLNRLALTAIGTAFFVLKFFGFALVVGLFVALVPALLAPDGEASSADAFRAVIAAGPGVAYAAGALFLSHGVSFVRNFLMEREYDRLTILSLVFWPYLRMSLVAGVLLLGLAVARVLPGLGRETAFAVVMILLKLAADALTHRFEHQT